MLRLEGTGPPTFEVDRVSQKEPRRGVKVLRRKQLPDFIQQPHAAVTDCKSLTERQALLPSGLFEGRQQQWNLSSHCLSGKAIADDKLHVATCRAAEAQPRY